MGDPVFFGGVFLGATNPICQGILILLVEGEGWGSFLGITFFWMGGWRNPSLVYIFDFLRLWKVLFLSLH